MIVVDVYVPSVDESFDFRLDENMNVNQLIQELAAVIGKKTADSNVPNPEKFVLYDLSTKQRISRYGSIADAGVKEGNRLILV